MKRRLFSCIICLILLSNIPVIGSATLQGIQYVIDEANLLSEKEHIELDSIASNLSNTYDIDVLIMTADSLEGKNAQEYAESLYDNKDINWNGSYWHSEDTILFLLAMEEREWYISTAGKAIYVFTDYGLDTLGQAVVPYLSDGEYYDGFCVYLELLPDYFDAYEHGSPIDSYTADYNPGNRQDTVYYEDRHEVNIFLSVLIGLITALVTVLIMWSTMNSQRRQHSAGDYLQAGSYHLRRHSDLFLYSNVTKVRRQENNNGGGGSRVHRGSGGVRHGGRGGKF